MVYHAHCAGKELVAKPDCVYTNSMSAIETIDTIAAVATPPGKGGVGIIRVSGPLATTIAKNILGHIPQPRRAEYLPFHDQNQTIIDTGIVLYFQAPNSFTGEDVLEFQGHGGPVVLDMLLQVVIQHGARLAHAGEFSERAFLNDKLDLAQAEAIADLIEAGSVQAARSAMRSLQGSFSEQIHVLVEDITQLRMYVEAAIDFPEEEVDFLADKKIAQNLRQIEQALDAVFLGAEQGVLLREGIRVVLVGQPNVGKSSLLNSLSQRESAIVTNIPGTTRDVVREEINVNGMPLHIIDTAGLRDSDDPVEQEGIKRTWQAIEQADAILYLLDESMGENKLDADVLDKLPKKIPVIWVHNKIDLQGMVEKVIYKKESQHIYLSAHSGQGLQLLRNTLSTLAGYQQFGEGNFIARRRHLEALQGAQTHLGQASTLLQQGQGELMAEELRLTQDCLGEITGEISSDDLLGRIFSSFCIGK